MSAGSVSVKESAASEPAEAVPGDLRMARVLWPVMLASAVGLLPFTVFSTYLVPIADTADTGVAAMGQLRGLGGLAALAVGTALAPFIDRVRKEWAAAGGLALLAVSALLGATGEFLFLAAFCLLVGAGTAVLNPALTAAAADRFGDGAAAGRAATLVTATQSFTALMAAPLVALPALLWGWQGNLLAVSVAAALLTAVFYVNGRRSHRDPALRIPRLGYGASFKALAAVPGAVPLLLVALLRTAAFMGYLAYLAAFYNERFDLSPGMFALVWTLSGTAFFLSNLFTGRAMSAAEPRITAERMMTLALAVGLVALVGFFFTHTLWLALLLTAVTAAAHATVAACVTTLLVRRCTTLRGTALSVNAAGMSFGVFAGAGLGGIGLGLAGYPGTALALGALTLGALLAALCVRRPG